MSEPRCVRYEESNELATRGWRTAFAQLVGPTLEDVRVHRQAIKIKDRLHTVSSLVLSVNGLF